jgi:hypothetical protein
MGPVRKMWIARLSRALDHHPKRVLVEETWEYTKLFAGVASLPNGFHFYTITDSLYRKHKTH